MMMLKVSRKEVWKYDLFYFSHKLFPLKEEPYNDYLANIHCLLLKNSSVIVGREGVIFKKKRTLTLTLKGLHDVGFQRDLSVSSLLTNSSTL